MGKFTLCEAHNQAGKDSTKITLRVEDSDDLDFPTTQRGPESPPVTSEVAGPVGIICLVAITGLAYYIHFDNTHRNTKT